MTIFLSPGVGNLMPGRGCPVTNSARRRRPHLVRPLPKSLPREGGTWRALWTWSDLSYNQELIIVVFPLSPRANLISQLFCLNEKGIPHFRQPLASSRFAKFGMTMQFMLEEEEAAIRKIYLYLILRFESPLLPPHIQLHGCHSERSEESPSRIRKLINLQDVMKD